VGKRVGGDGLCGFGLWGWGGSEAPSRLLARFGRVLGGCSDTVYGLLLLLYGVPYRIFLLDYRSQRDSTINHIVWKGAYTGVKRGTS